MGLCLKQNIYKNVSFIFLVADWYGFKALISHSVIKSILQFLLFSLILKKQKASLSFGSGLPSLLPYVLA